MNTRGTRAGVPEYGYPNSQINGLKTIGITTNGILVARKLAAIGECVDQINISLDTLDPLKFVLITRRNGWERVRAAIDLAIDAGIPQARRRTQPTPPPRHCPCPNSFSS
jgi:hypothetical protein